MVSESVTHRAESRRFEVDLGADGVAYVAYAALGDGVIDLRHTIVPEAAQGRGVGSSLIAGVFDLVRRDGMRVVATCPFVAAWLTENPEAEDVVADR